MWKRLAEHFISQHTRFFVMISVSRSRIYFSPVLSWWFSLSSRCWWAAESNLHFKSVNLTFWPVTSSRQKREYFHKKSLSAISLFIINIKRAFACEDEHFLSLKCAATAQKYQFWIFIINFFFFFPQMKPSHHIIDNDDDDEETQWW